MAQVHAPAIAGGHERGPLLDGSVAIDAVDGRGSAWLAVEPAVAMNIRVEVAIDALHPVREMGVLQVDSPGKLFRIVMRDDLIVEVKQVSPAVLLEHGTENPAVSVVIGKLVVLERWIFFGDLFQE